MYLIKIPIETMFGFLGGLENGWNSNQNPYLMECVESESRQTLELY